MPLTVAGTDYILMPVGTTGQRPSTPVAGMTRYNSTTGLLEYYNGTAWTNPGGYTLEFLVVGGGGGGGVSGGGAGGMLTGSGYVVNPSSAYTVTIGAGGATATAGVTSSFGANLYGYGGGRGVTGGYSGGSGGSGGGAYSGDNTNSYAVGLGIPGQGNNGGLSYPNFTGSGGGGGAGAVGGTGYLGGGGDGGAGASSSISGTATNYAGGGGGGGNTSGGGTGGAGGAGGGGAGATLVNATAGTANTGGGGGGSFSGTGGAGGSGIIVVRYLGAQRGTGGAVTSSGGYTIHTFTSSGTFTA